MKLGKEIEGVHKALYNCILKCDSEITMDFYRNILLSGGNTMFQVGEQLNIFYKLQNPLIEIK